MIGPKYTHQAGAHWPNSLIDLTDYKDADNTVGLIIAQIKEYQEAGDFDSAQDLINQHASTLKQYCFDSAAINKYVEELRNLQIYTKAKKQQIFYEPTEEMFSFFAVLNDVWLGNVGDGSSVVDQSTAQDFNVLEGITYVGADGKLHTGTMPNYGAIEATLEAGQSYTIPAGYHNGGGIITVDTVVPEGQNLDLGVYERNGRPTGIPVTGASTVSMTIAVPTVMTSDFEVINGTTEITNLPQEITQFVIVIGKSSHTSAANSVVMSWIKDVNGNWVKKDYKTQNKIMNVSGNAFTVKWTTDATLTYFAW